MPAFLLVLLAFLTGFRVWAEPLYPLLSPAGVDSVRTLLRQSKPDTNRVNWLLQLGENFLNKSQSDLIPGDLDSAGRYCGEALTLSRSLQYKKGQIRSGYLSGILASRQGNFAQGVLLVKQALTLSQEVGNLPLEAEGGTTWEQPMNVRRKTFPKKSGAGHKRGNDTGSWVIGRKKRICSKALPTRTSSRGSTCRGTANRWRYFPSTAQLATPGSITRMTS